MIRKLKIATKFVIMLFVMTIVCSIGWAFVAGDLYDCTDPAFMDFLTPGDWVHNWSGHPILTVEKIVHGRSMSEPDTIRQGWSVTALWCLWFSFVGISSAASIFLSRKTWISGPTMPPLKQQEMNRSLSTARVVLLLTLLPRLRGGWNANQSLQPTRVGPSPSRSHRWPASLILRG